MIRRFVPGALAAACFLGLAAPWVAANDTPHLVIERRGFAPAVRGTAMGDTRVAAPATSAATEASQRARDLRRSFPHDLRSPGAAQRPLLSLDELLAARRNESGVLRTSMAGADTVRIALFRVDFLQDSAADSSTGNGRFDLRKDVRLPVDPPPHDANYFHVHAEALRRYYDVQSYGTMHLEISVFPPGDEAAYHLNDTKDYGPWSVQQAAEVVFLAERFVTDALNVVDAAGDFAFRDYDGFVLVHAGADFQGDINRDTPYDVPSFNITLGDSIVLSSGKVGQVMVVPETASQDGRIAALNGVYAHEMGHVLGLPDLYDIYTGIPQVGEFSLMDSGDNIGAFIVDPATDDVFFADGVMPTSMDPWSKLQVFPRVIPKLVGESWSGDLEAVEVAPDIALVPIDPFEYFLLENRAIDVDGNQFPFVRQDSTTNVFLGPADDPDNPDGGGHTEYDALLPARDLDRDELPDEGGGVLIWHIDDKLVIPALADRGQVNQGIGYRGIALEEADGVWDQGRFNLGRVEDAWFDGNKNRFADDTVPDTRANDGAHSGISLVVRGAPLSRFMSVEIENVFARDTWPVLLRRDAQFVVTPERLAAIDLNQDGTREVVFVTRVERSGSNRPLWGVAAVDGQGTPYQGTLIDTLLNRITDGIAVSDQFVVTPGQQPEPVFALTDNNGQVFLWDRTFTQRASRVQTALATTPPVLMPGSAGDPGRLVHGGRGELVVRDGTAALVHRSAASLGAGAFPAKAPAILRGARYVDALGGAVAGDLAALAFDNGAVELLALREAPAPAGPGRGLMLIQEPDHLVVGTLDVDTSLPPVPQLVVVTPDSLWILDPALGVTAQWFLPARSVLTPVVADLDADGRDEVVCATQDGTLSVWNGDGSPAVGWPRAFVGPPRDLKVVDLDGDQTLDVLILDRNGRFLGFTGAGKLMTGFPRASGPFNLGPSLLERADTIGDLTWFAVAKEGAILATRFPDSRTLPGDWRYPGGLAEGGAAQTVLRAPDPDHPDLDGGRFLVYPNPAVGPTVNIRFVLDDDESAQLRIFDVAGTELTDAVLRGNTTSHPGENALEWDLTAVAPGLYFCRLERSGDSGSTIETARVAVLR